MEHRWLKLFKHGEWTGRPCRTITVKGIEHNMDEYAKQHGIELPDAKKNNKPKDLKKQVNTNADMEQQDSSRDTEEHEHRDSKSTE